MRVVNSGALPAANSSKFQLPKIIAFDDYKLCERMRTEVTVPLLADGTGGTIGTADVLALLRAIFASVTMFWGDQAKDIIDNALSFDRMRELHLACVQRDIPIVITLAAGPTVVFNGPLAAGISAVVPAGSAPTITFELIRPFVYERFGSKQTDFCPGPSQMRSMDYSFQRGPLATLVSGHITENGAASVSIIFDDVATRIHDRWANVIRLQTTSLAGQEVPGPEEGGALLCLYEYTATLANSALKNFSLYGDTTVLHDQIQPLRVGRDEYERLPLGSTDLNTATGTTCTVLFDLMDALDLADVPKARKFRFRQAALDIAQPQLGWVMAPPITEQYRDAIIGPNAMGPTKRTVKLVNAGAVTGQASVSPQTRSMQPVAILTSEHPAYATTAGRLFQKNTVPSTHIPATLTSAVQAASNAHGDNSDSALHQAVVHAASSVPGAMSVEKGAATPTLLAAFAHMAPGNKGSDTSALTNFVSSLKQIF